MECEMHLGSTAALFCDAQGEVIHVIYAIQQIESDSGSDLQHSELGVS
jgi:hypothetical protein